MLQSQEQAWSRWSTAVGLLENAAKTEITALGTALRRQLKEVFNHELVKQHVKLLGLLGASILVSPRALTEAEHSRFKSAQMRLQLLGCVGFGLSTFVREAKTFALSKANFGWIARSPTLSASRKLWSCVWKAAARIRDGPVLCFGPTATSMFNGLFV